MESTSLTLLGQARQGDQSAWRRIVAIYQPFITGWLRNRGVQFQDAEDLSNDVMAVLVRKLPDFEHAGRQGSFRKWLRTVAGNRANKFFAAGRCRPDRAYGGTVSLDSIGQLADDTSELAQQWDREHDEHLFRRLLELIEGEFEPQTVAVFRRLVINEEKSADVARDTGLSLAAVYAAKSRVLARLRAEIAPFLEENQ